MFLYRAKKIYFTSFLSLLMGMSLLGCAAENKPQNQLRSDGNFSASLPKSLNAANISENNLIVEIIIDPEKEPQDRRRLQNLVVDPESKVFSGDIPGIIPAGPHTFRLVFIFDDPTYGATEVAVSGDVNIEVIANQDTPINFSTALMTLTDTDGDSRTNLEELERGWDPTLAAPAAPQNLSAIPSDQEVALTWDAVTGADSYTIYWNTSGSLSTDDLTVSSLTSTDFTHSERINGTTYYYTVTASGLGGESLYSSEVSTAPFTSVPKVDITTPLDAATGTELDIEISATFSMQMDSLLFHTGTFKLESVAGSVAGTVTYSESPDFLATFIPLEVLAPSTEYTVTLSSTLSSFKGVSLMGDYQWRFTTRNRKWGTPELIEFDNTGPASFPQVTIDLNGDAVAVWQQSDGARNNIWANQYVAESGWRNAQAIESNINSASEPHVVSDLDGNAISVWIQWDGTLYSVWSNQFVPDSGWGDAVKISVGDTTSIGAPKVVADPRGGIIAFWEQVDAGKFNLWSNRFVPGLAWEGASLVVSDNSGHIQFPDVAVDLNGNATAVWNQWDGTRTNIWASRFSPNIGWEQAEMIEFDDAGGALFPDVEVDSNGNFIAIWRQSDGTRNSILANRFVPGIGWERNAVLIQSNNTGDAGLFPDLVLDSNGNAIAIWSQTGDTGTNIWANRFSPGVGWGSAISIEADNTGRSQVPQVAVDLNGDAIVVWEESGGSLSNILANRFVPDMGWESAVLVEKNSGDHAFSPKVSVAPNGDAIAIWYQSDGNERSIWVNHFE